MGGAWGRWWVKRSRGKQVMESKAGQSVFNWLCRLEGQRSRAQHGAVTLHYSQWSHNESPCNQVPTDQSFKTHTCTHTHCRQQSNSLLTHLPVPWFRLNPHHRCNLFFCRFIVPEIEFCSDSRDEKWNDLRDKYSVTRRARLLLRCGSLIIVVTGASRSL